MIAPFDRQAVRQHRDRAAAQIGQVMPLLDDFADRLLDRLDDTTHRFHHALDIGGRGAVASRLRARGVDVISTDMSAKMLLASNTPHLIAADEELLPFGPDSFDLVVANLSLHWVNDLPGTLLQIRRCMRPDSLFLASLPLPGTLGALRAALIEAETALTGGASPRIAPFPDLRDLAGLLQRAGFVLPVADADTIMLQYANPQGLFRDLRDAGETNALAARSRTTPPAALFAAAMAAMPIAEGRLSVPLNIGVLTGWTLPA